MKDKTFKSIQIEISPFSVKNLKDAENKEENI